MKNAICSSKISNVSQNYSFKIIYWDILVPDVYYFDRCLKTGLEIEPVRPRDHDLIGSTNCLTADLPGSI